MSAMSVKDIWEIYSNARTQFDQQQTRSLALNVFLAMCCKEVEENEEIPIISDMKSIVNQLCTEFMNDIIHITNTAEDDCDPAVLESYMVKGRGWQLLQVIHKSGVQGLTVGRDFSNLIVSLLPWCLKFKTDNEDVKSSVETGLPTIGSCFVRLHKSPKWLKSCQQRNKVIPKRNHKKSQHQGQNTKVRYQRVLDNKQENGKYSESDDEDADVPSQQKKHKRTRNIFRRNPFVDFNGRTIKDEDDGDGDEVEEISLILSRIDVNCTAMNPPEICQVILNILLEICLQDLNQSSISKFLSPIILPNLIQVLTSFYPKSDVRNQPILASQWTKNSNIYFQRKLLRLILTLCGIIAVQQNGVNIIASHKCLQDLLDIAQQIYNLQGIKMALAGSTSKDKGSHTVTFDLELCYLTEITLSSVILLDIVFQCLPLNIVFINNAVQLARDFINGNGFTLMQFVLTHLDWLRNNSYKHSDWSHAEPVKIIDSFLSTLKSVKVHYIHSVKCQKSKHQRCDFSSYFNHHHNILGDSQTMNGEMLSAENENDLMSTACLISSWCNFLLDSLSKIDNKLSRIEVLRTFHKSAICCCMKLDIIAKKMLDCLPQFSTPVQKYSLEIFNAVILENFSKREIESQTLQQKLSRLCSFCFDRRGSSGIDSKVMIQQTADSGFSSHGLKVETNYNEMAQWTVCDMFKQVLFSSDKKLTEVMSKQLLNLVMNGNADWKKELFFRVYSFAFSAFLGTGRTSSPFSSEEEHSLEVNFSKKVKVHCLSALPHLLEVDKVLHEFLQNKGIGRICRLLEDENLRSPVLKVFEALVILDEDKLSESDVIFSKETADESVLPKNGLVIKAFIGGLASMTLNNTCLGKKNCVIDFVQMFHNCDVQLCCLYFAEKMTKNLTLLVDMWETCARICLHSKRFVFHFQNSPSLKIAENALLLIIKQLLCSNKCDLPEGSEDSGLDVDVSKASLPTSCCYLELLLMKSLLIVCSASYKSLIRKDGLEISMWKRLTEAFQACSNLPPTKVKTVCDVLLLSAMPNKTTILDHTKLQSLSDLFLKDDDIDDDEIRQYIHTTSEEDYDSIRVGEGGYYGDTECGSDENETTVRSPANGCNKEVYPAVFRILVELMIVIKNKEGMVNVLGQVLQKLLQTMRASHKATLAICQEGLLEEILVGFWNYMIEDKAGSSVRSSLLSLIQLMSQHRMTSTELKKIFQLFNYSVIPQDVLLSAFLSIVENSQPQPHYSVTFPCKRTLDVSPKSSLVQSTLRRRETRADSAGGQSPFFASVSWVMVTTPDTTEGSFDLFNTSTTQDIWDLAAMFIPVQGLPWPPFGLGMTVALWVKLSEDQENVVKITRSTTGNHVYFTSTEAFGSKEQVHQGKSAVEVSECIHLVSLGNTEKMLELWVHTFSGHLVIRLTTEYGESSHILKDVMSKECLMKGHWHHVVLGYSEDIPQRNGECILRGKIQLVIDGWKSQELSLDHQFSVRNKRSSGIPLLCVGHAVTDPHKSSQSATISSIMLFEGSNHGCDEVFHLYAQGPSCVTITKCDNVKIETSYGTLLTKDMEKHSKIPTEILVGSKRIEFDSLRSSLIVSYNPMMPDVACFYRDHSYQEMQAALASNLGIAQRPQDDLLLIQQPITAQFTCQGKVIGHRHHGLEKALEGAGGMEAVLFLVAQVFELNKEDSKQKDTEHELLQAKSLQILFSMANFSTHMTKDYQIINGNQLLNRVLTSSRAVIGYHTVKVLLDAATSESMIRFELDGTLVMRKKSEAMIRNVSIIVDLLLHWRIWEGYDEDILVMIFHALASLVRHDHPHQGLNLKQFHSVNLINVIFKIYQERIQDSKKSYSTEIAQSVISILQSMLGSPPDLLLVMAVVDFLILVHPATNSYVQHSKSSFYFTTWWNDKSPRTRKDSTYVKSNLHKTSTPHGPKTSTSPSVESTDKKSKKELDWSISTSGNQMDYGSPKSISDFENTTLTSRNRSRSLVESSTIEGNYLGSSPADSFGSYSRSLSPKHQLGEFVETVSDLENSDSHASTDIHQPHRGLSLELAREHKISTGSSGGESPNSEKLTKFSMLRRIGSFASSGSLSREFSTDDEEGLYAPRPEIGFDDEDWDLDAEKGLVALCVGLLETITNVLLTLPDNKIGVFLKVIRPDIALVLSHHSSPQIRTTVIKVINAYLLRASKELVEEFMQKQSFHLLAVQLHSYPTHTEQIEDVLSFILGKPFTFDNNSAMEEINEPHELQQASVVVFLSLIENTYRDIPLCHNTLTLVTKLIDESDVMGSLMLEHRIVEMLTNLVARINSVTTRCTDIDGIDEYQLIFEDIRKLLCNVITREFRTSGLVHFQQCEEILDILTMLEKVEEIVYGKDSRQAVTVKTLRYRLIMCVFSFVEVESQEKPSQLKARGLKRTSSSMSYANQVTMSFLSSFSQSLPAPPAGIASGSSLADPITDEPIEEFFTHTDGDSTRPKLGLITRAFSMDSKTPGFLSNILGFGKKKRFEMVAFSQSEFIDRLKKWIVTAVDTIINAKHEEVKKAAGKKKLNLFEKSEPVTIETVYIRKLFEFLYRSLEQTLAQDRILPRREKNTILWGAKDVIRVQICRVIVYMLSPLCLFDDRSYLLSYIQGESRGREVLRIVLSTNSEVGLEMGIHIYDLCTTWRDWLNTQQRDYAYQFLNILKSQKIMVFSPNAKLTEAQIGQLNEEKRAIAAKTLQGRELFRKKKKPVYERIKTKTDKLCQDLSKQAMDVTQNVTQLQTQERNKMVEHVKKKMTEKIQIKKLWQELVQNLTHDRAVWYSERSYPKSWQLDPTEGPGRVRKRLKRCHLGIKPRFLHPEFRYKLDAEEIDPPLIYLFEDDHQVSDSAALIYQLYRNEKIQHTYKCTAVAPNTESKGELLVGENSVFFVADEAITDANYTQVLLGNKDQLSMTWPYDEIREIHKRWYQLRDNALEIFLTNGRTCLLACEKKWERDELYIKFMSFELSNLILTENIEDIQKSWQNGLMTNFDYLTHLNKLAGRSFNDLMQYPVFPFILKDYVSDRLNLLNAESYRNLAKPISVQNESKEMKYKENYEALKLEWERSMEDQSAVRPYHYGSHYSNSGIVLHFLVRLPPFTKMFVSYQDNNFDLPDRTFHNMETCWRLASFQSSTDFKEMIPEFFFLPEFLKNFEGFAFGKRQNNEDVFDVMLPRWCKDNPRLFMIIMRQALESDYVRLNLHHWIDLVFGYKQQGDPAVRAINVFHPATYFGIDVDSVQDKLKRNALQAMVKTYGQTPKQLFRNPHPQGTMVRENTSKVISQLVQQSYNVSVDNDFDHGFASYVPCPIDTVDGIKWGNFIGSPSKPPPQVVWQEKYSQVVATLLPLPTGDVIGVGMDTCCLTMNSKRKVSTLYNTTDVVWAAIVTWKFPDGILRINNKPDQPYLNLILHSPYDMVTYIAAIADCPYLFVGCESGSITVYQTVFNQAKASDIQIKREKKVLYGHTRKVTQIVICKPYSIFVSASEDKTCIIWDLNKLSYVRSIEGNKQSVDVVAISPTSGDIAFSSRHGLGSCLHLHSINSDLIATYTSQDHVINCLAFSTAPEGQSINVVAGGLDNGVIRIWSTIDLRHLRDLQTENLMLRPVISVTFTCDSQRLYSTLSDGTVALWESPSNNKHLLPHKFVAFLG